MEKANNMVNRAISATKTLKAPIEKVWQAWTDPEQVINWWGPNGFTTTINKMDVNDGGEWHLTMLGPDGKIYPNKSKYIEVRPFKKIVFEHSNPNYIATIIFESEEQETIMQWTTMFETAELFETVVKVFKADEGLKQNIEKLEKYLKHKP